MLQGFKFGFIDNTIVAISALIGIEIDKLYSGYGTRGALYGALIGHTLSDMFAGYMDFGYEIALNMGLGCFTVLVIVYLYFYIFERSYNNSRKKLLD